MQRIQGDFIERAENVLVFGLPGRGKSHLCAALGHELVRRGHSVLFTPTYRLVQHLLRAKRDLVLERELARLDAFDADILDDIGYVRQDRDEMEVLFTFLAERYERRSVLMTSKPVGSNLQGPHHDGRSDRSCGPDSVIVELTGRSIRDEEARARNGARDGITTGSTTTTTNDNYQPDGEV